MPQKTCNLFFLGTQHHRDNAKGKYNIIHQYFKNTVDDDFSHKRLFDGPGGIADSRLGKQKNPMPGLYTMDFEKNKKVRLTESRKSLVYKFLKKCKFISGSLFGDGVENNILEAIQYLGILEQQGKLPDKINLYGFSRGGDTSIMLSNLLWRLYPDIEVNICVVDPVPGLHDIKRHESKLIPPNVNNMTAILMQDEATPGFTPTDQEHMIVASPSTTKINYQIYRGYHGTSTVKTGDDNIESTRILAHDSFYRFAKANGTRLIDGKSPPYGCKIKNENGTEDLYEIENDHPNGLSNQERLIPYTKMKDHAYHLKNKHLVLKRHLDTSVKNGDYHKDPDFFINQEHREIFALTFPATFDYLFKGNMQGYTIGQIELEIQQMHNSKIYPISLYRSMIKKGIEFDQKSQLITNMPPPSGIPVPERLLVTNNLPVVYDEISYIKHAVKDIIDQFEILHDSENIYKNISDKLYFSNKILSISEDFRKALDKFNNSTEPDNKRIYDLKQVVLEKYSALLKVKKIDVLNLHQFSVVQQMNSLVEAELYAQQISEALDSVIQSNSKKNFLWMLPRKSNSNSIPKKDLENLHIFKSRLSRIISNDQMPERDKIVAMNLIMEDVKKYISQVPKSKNFFLNTKWNTKLKQFSKKLDSIESNYITYADRVSNSFYDLEVKHKIFAAAFKVISFTKTGNVLYKKHTDKAQRAMEAKDACIKLKKTGEGNNQDELLKVLDNVISKDFIDGTNYFSNDVEAVARKLKEEISVLRGTRAHLIKW